MTKVPSEAVTERAVGESYISIEQMLFGDYRVCVYDKNNNSLLDKDYFCHGFASAMLTAVGIQKDLFPGLEITTNET